MFVAAKLKGRRSPRVVEIPVWPDTELTSGWPVRESDGAITNFNTLSPRILGVVLESFGPDWYLPGPLNAGTRDFRGFPPGYAHVVLAQDEQPFHGSYKGTLPAAPGGSYGVAQDGLTGYWVVDFDVELGRYSVKYLGPFQTQSPFNAPRVLFCFLPEVIQEHGA